MPTTTGQDRRFALEHLSGVLEEALEYLVKNLDPEDILGEGALVFWARENARKHLDPEDVFPEEELRTWALDHGYTESD